MNNEHLAELAPSRLVAMVRGLEESLAEAEQRQEAAHREADRLRERVASLEKSIKRRRRH